MGSTPSMPGEVMQESAELAGLWRIGPQRLEAVDDHDRRPVLADEVAYALEYPWQALVTEHDPEVVVEHGGADGGRIEERQRLTVAEDLLERFRDG